MIEKVQFMALLFISGLKGKHDERGATSVEYGLMVVLIAVVIAATVAILGTAVDGLFHKVLDAPW